VRQSRGRAARAPRGHTKPARRAIFARVARATRRRRRRRPRRARRAKTFRIDRRTCTIGRSRTERRPGVPRVVTSVIARAPARATNPRAASPSSAFERRNRAKR
jgi:hypothetical protein